MSYQHSADRGQSFRVIRRSFLQTDGLPFSDILSEEAIEQAFVENDALRHPIKPNGRRLPLKSRSSVFPSFVSVRSCPSERVNLFETPACRN